jgi:hypothetical protein
VAKRRARKRPPLPVLGPSRNEIVESYASDPDNARAAELAIEVAQYGHFVNLAHRLRNLAKLTKAERELIADILEGKFKKKGRPSSMLKRGEATKIAMFVARNGGKGRFEAAVKAAQKKFGLSHGKITSAVRETKQRFEKTRAVKKDVGISAPLETSCKNNNPAKDNTFNLTKISAIAKTDPARARELLTNAGKDPNAWLGKGLFKSDTPKI